MVQNVLMASLGTGISLNTDITKGVFDRFRRLPIARSAPLVGAVLGDVVRYVVALGILIVFAMILGFRVHTDSASFVAAFALMLFTFGSNLFAPASTMPARGAGIRPKGRLTPTDGGFRAR